MCNDTYGWNWLSITLPCFLLLFKETGKSTGKGGKLNIFHFGKIQNMVYVLPV